MNAAFAIVRQALHVYDDPDAFLAAGGGNYGKALTALNEIEHALQQATEALQEIVDRHERSCGVHEAPLPDDVALAETYAIARAVLARDGEQE